MRRTLKLALAATALAFTTSAAVPVPTRADVVCSLVLEDHGEVFSGSCPEYICRNIVAYMTVNMPQYTVGAAEFNWNYVGPYTWEIQGGGWSQVENRHYLREDHYASGTLTAENYDLGGSCEVSDSVTW